MWFCNKSAIEEGHNIECRADDAVIFTQTVRFWHRHFCISKSMYYFEFSIDLMGSLGKQLSRWLLPHNVFVSVRGNDLICRIRLTKTKLLAVSLEARS